MSGRRQKEREEKEQELRPAEATADHPDGQATEDSGAGDAGRRSRHPGALQFLKFITVGVFNTAIELGVYNLLLLLYPARHDLALLAVYSTGGVVAAIACSYVLNSRWAFRESKRRPGGGVWHQRALFVAQACVNIGINDGVTVGATSLLSEVHVLPLVVSQNLAKFLAMSASSLSSFAMLRFFVFGARTSRP